MKNARTSKTSTDEFWDRRAVEHSDNRKVNIDDLPQRQCENQFVFGHLQTSDKVLEVGCGNGFLTSDLRELVSHVDGFDFAENMIDRAKKEYGETNNRFFTGSVLDPNAVTDTYDAVVCVRVLINVASTEEQQAAVRNMAKWVAPGGRLLFVEGFLDGFDALNAMRENCGLERMQPAKINHYDYVSTLKSVIEESFDIVDEWSSGTFDMLTRVVYPLLVGAENATESSDFHMKTVPLALALDDKHLFRFGRLRGFHAIRR